LSKWEQMKNESILKNERMKFKTFWMMNVCEEIDGLTMIVDIGNLKKDENMGLILIFITHLI